TAPASNAQPASPPTVAGIAGAGAPPLPADVQQAFAIAQGDPTGILYRPRVLAPVRLHYVDRASGVDTWDTRSLAAPFDDSGAPLWDEAQPAPAALSATPVTGASFADLPAAAMRAASYAAWAKALTAWLYQHQRLQLLACDALKLVSAPGESEGDFRARLQLAARERRDAETSRLQQKYAPRLASLRDQLARARQRVERERGQASQQKVNTAISVGATLLGALFGRKAVSATSVGRATTAARSASRIGPEAEDVARAEESLQTLEQRLADLEKELATAVAGLEDAHAPAQLTLRPVEIAPRKADIGVGQLQLLWTPWRRGADGFPVEAS